MTSASRGETVASLTGPTVALLNSPYIQRSHKINYGTVGPFRNADVGIADVRCVDAAYGDDSFVFADARALGFRFTADEARELAETGIRITNAAKEQLGFTNPDNQEWSHMSFCELTPAIEERIGALHGRNTVVIKHAKPDRSPPGTGCLARIALRHARGQISAGAFLW
ncbi:proline racemase family protein [Agrobacterium tomkonis]|uniref:proline racemase family protein n=1 Tax=Agrobacterium tomkonis TaxID=1183410 RepID=UPI001CD8B959